MARSTVRSALIFAAATWPLLVGVILDVIDLVFGDIAEGAEWALAGALGTATASLPATLACFFLRARGVLAFLGAGLLVGVIISAAIGFWMTLNPPDPLLGGIFFVIAPLVIGASALTGFAVWLIRRPARDAPNPPTSAP